VQTLKLPLVGMLPQPVLFAGIEIWLGRRLGRGGFDLEQIDTAHRGYVTQEDIQAFLRERSAQRRAGSQGVSN
jgi:hypothetical protein